MGIVGTNERIVEVYLSSNKYVYNKLMNNTYILYVSNRL